MRGDNDQLSSLAQDAQDALHPGAIHPSRGTRVPGPAAAADVGPHR